jgi:hypothetical protein
MTHHKSPEEKLLALIKGAKKEGHAEPPGRGAAGPQAAAGDARGEDGRNEKAPETKRQPSLAKAIGARFSKIAVLDAALLRKLNLYLIIASALIFVYLIAEVIFVHPQDRIKDAISGPAARQAKAVAAPSLPEDNDSYSAYEGRIGSRQIFDKSGAGGDGGHSIATSEDVSQLIGLVGIMPGNPPQAIIEDKKNQKTYYLKKGESFNDFTVENIAADMVTVDNGGRKVTLSL